MIKAMLAFLCAVESLRILKWFAVRWGWTFQDICREFEDEQDANAEWRRFEVSAEDIAKDIGKQLNDRIICPRCRIDGRKDEDQQTLSTYVDLEGVLFCPHCEMDVHLKVSNL